MSSSNFDSLEPSPAIILRNQESDFNEKLKLNYYQDDS